MSKFSDKVVDGLSLVAEKVDENKFLGAIKDSFTIYMPFVIVGSFMSLFNTIPFRMPWASTPARRASWPKRPKSSPARSPSPMAARRWTPPG